MQMRPKVSQPSGRAICVRADTRHACRQAQAGGLRRQRERLFHAKTAAGARKPRRIHPNCAHADHAPAHLPPSRQCTRRRTSSGWRRRACCYAIRPVAPRSSSTTTPSSNHHLRLLPLRRALRRARLLLRRCLVPHACGRGRVGEGERRGRRATRQRVPAPSLRSSGCATACDRDGGGPPA